MKYIICFFTLLISAHSNDVISDPIVAGRMYEAGTRLHSSWTGLSFDVPATYRAYYSPDAQGVVMESATDGRIIGVYGFTNATLEELGDAMVTLIQNQGIQLSIVDLESEDERTQKAKFLAVSEMGIGSLSAMVRGGDYGNAIAIAVLGAQGTDEELEAVAFEVMNSVQWEKPDHPDWNSLLGGKHFTTSESDSQYSPGGAGGYGSYASGSYSYIDFCTDGTYAYSTRSESYISIEGASAERISSDAHNGRWSMVADLAGEVTLVLESTDDRVFYWDIAETGGGAHVNGTNYGVRQSTACY